MSAFDYYKKLGFTNFTAHKDVSNGGSNVVVKTPTTSLRLVITNLNIGANIAGTIVFFFGGANQIRLAQFFSSGSGQIIPSISGWESTATDAPFYAVASASGTEGWKITAEGFELE